MHALEPGENPHSLGEHVELLEMESKPVYDGADQ